jgi:two-component system OmpR family response regulator
VLRRTGDAGRETSEGTLTFAGWRLAAAQRELRDPDGVLVPLTSGEFDLLLAFVERPERVLSRDQLLDLTKGRDAVPFDRSIDVQLSRLRRKIEIDPQNPKLIKTVRGGGYMLAQPVRRS